MHQKKNNLQNLFTTIAVEKVMKFKRFSYLGKTTDGGGDTPALPTVIGLISEIMIKNI